MPVVGLFGISNDGLNLAVNLLVVLLVVVYLALIVWTFLDARRRIEDSWLVACATAASLFPFVGAMVYSILRPPEFIEDRKERELEIRASQLRVKQLGEQSCPNCEYPVERNYLRCPNCESRLKDPCPTCQKPIDPRWAMCPYCETPIRSRQAERRPSGRRRARPERPDREPPSREAQRAARASREGRQSRPPSGDAPKRRAKPRAKAPDSDGQAPPAPPRQPKPPADSENTAERAAARSRSSRAPETSGGEE